MGSLRPCPLPLAAVLAVVLACEPPPLRVENVPDGPLPAGTLWPLGSSGRGTVEWLVDDSTVATVTPGGIVWARSPGRTQIRVWRGLEQANVVVDVTEPADGKVVFIADGAIRVVRPAGRGETVLPVDVGYGIGGYFRLDVSPDGEAVAFTRQDGGIYWMRLDGTGLRRVSPDTAYVVAFAGDDRLVYNGSRGSAIRVVDLAEGSVTTLWSEEPPRADGATLYWIPSLAWGGGDTLYFAGATKGFPYDERLGAAQRVDSLYVARIPDVSGSRRTIAHALARNPEIPWPGPDAALVSFEGISVSPDRKWLLVNYGDREWAGPMWVDASDPAAEPVRYGPPVPRWTLLEVRVSHLGDRAVGAIAGPNPYVMGGLVVFGKSDSEFSGVLDRPAIYESPVWSP